MWVEESEGLGNERLLSSGIVAPAQPDHMATGVTNRFMSRLPHVPSRAPLQIFRDF